MKNRDATGPKRFCDPLHKLLRRRNEASHPSAPRRIKAGRVNITLHQICFLKSRRGVELIQKPLTPEMLLRRVRDVLMK